MPNKAHTVTRIGTRDGAALVGRVQLRTRPSRIMLRRVREGDDKSDPTSPDETAAVPGPVEVSAFDGWLTATPVRDGGHLCWQIAID